MYNQFQNQQQAGAPAGGNYFQQPQLQQTGVQQQFQQHSYGNALGSQNFGYNPGYQQSAYGSTPNLPSQQSGGAQTFGNRQNASVMQNQVPGPYYTQQMQQPQSTAPAGNYQGSAQMMAPMQPTQSQGTGYYQNTSMNSTLTGPGQPMFQQNTQPLQPLQPLQQPQDQNSGFLQGIGTVTQPTLQPLTPQPAQPQISIPPAASATSAPQALLPQQTGFYTQRYQAPVEPLKPTATGFVNSFANRGLNNDLKIPAIRLSFITAKDQAKFETLFRASVKPGSNTITGADCRTILLKSGLAPSQLAKIWSLCDTSKAGVLLFPEFALAMHLVNDVLQGDSIPFELDSKTKNEVSSFIDAINLQIATSEQAPKTPFDEMITAGMPTLQPQPTGMMPATSFGVPLQTQVTGTLMPQTSFGMAPQLTGSMVPQTSFGPSLQAQLTGSGLVQPSTMQTQVTGPGAIGGMPQLTFGSATAPPTMPMGLQPQATGYLPPSNFNPTMPLTAQKTGFGNNEIYTQSNFARNLANQMNEEMEDRITPEEKSLFYKIFETYDTKKAGLLDSPTAVEIFRKSGLNRSDLEHIWNLCDTNNSGQLNKQEFALGMHLVYRKLNGQSIPNRLPPSLIPSSTRILDNVKNQLKSSSGWDSQSSTTKRNIGLSYKNDDDDEGSLPSFRNRRRNFPATQREESATPESPTVAEVSKKYPDINKSSSPALESSPVTAVQNAPSAPPAPTLPQQLQKTSSTAAASVTSSGGSLDDELRRIASLRTEIERIQLPTFSSNSNIPLDLRKKFNNLLNKIPDLFAEIYAVDSKITSTKLELLKSEAPSDIEGTGPGGEITESDRKKARSKALLRARMAALTGKPVGSDASGLEGNEQRNAEEISRIENESTQNQAIIGDIVSSIADISSSLKSTMCGRKIYDNADDFKKWEFGVGLNSEIRQFIKKLNDDTKLATEATTPSSTQQGSGTSSYSQLKSSEDRAAYLKEQAQKRMKERLAKFGLNRRESSHEVMHEAPSTTPKPAPTTPFIEEKTNEPIRSVSSNQHQQSLDSAGKGEEEDEDEDEEERQLREQLERLKMKKKAEKEKRLAELRKQIAEAEAEGSEDSDNGGNFGSTSAPVPAPAPAPANTQTRDLGTTPYGSRNYSAAQNNTAIVGNGGAGSAERVPASAVGRNPFFKQETTPSTSSFDARSAEQQRRIQRGLDLGDGDDDDDWSDAEETVQQPSQQVQQSTSAPVATAPPPVPATSQMNTNGTSSFIPPVPIAPPIPQIGSVGIATGTNASSPIPPVPIAPPLPQVQAPSNNNSSSYQVPPVPIAPPLPQINSEPVATNLAVTDNNSDNDDDILSIPESVASDSSGGTSGIPPPPPLP